MCNHTFSQNTLPDPLFSMTLAPDRFGNSRLLNRQNSVTSQNCKGISKSTPSDMSGRLGLGRHSQESGKLLCESCGRDKSSQTNNNSKSGKSCSCSKSGSLTCKSDSIAKPRAHPCSILNNAASNVTSSRRDHKSGKNTSDVNVIINDLTSASPDDSKPPKSKQSRPSKRPLTSHNVFKNQDMSSKLSTESPIHSLLHFAGDQSISRFDYTSEDCPVCITENLSDTNQDSCDLVTSSSPETVAVSTMTCTPVVSNNCLLVGNTVLPVYPTYCLYSPQCFTPFLNSVFVDITGRNVTLSIERFASIEDSSSHSPRRKPGPWSTHPCSTSSYSTSYFTAPASETTPSRSRISRTSSASSSSRLGPSFVDTSSEPSSSRESRQNSHFPGRYANNASCNSVGSSQDFFLPRSGAPAHVWCDRRNYVAPLFPLWLPEILVVPRNNDVFNSLKTCLVPIDCLKTYVVSHPPNRVWRQLEKPNSDGMQFTVMCYNVLCPKYASTNFYPYCPSWALLASYRCRGVLEEIKTYNADIICLQELETHQYEEIYKVELEKNKYEMVFIPKSRHRNEVDVKTVDGCAIFWKSDRFKKVYDFSHEFSLSCTKLSETPATPLLDRVMPRDNVSIGVIFETTDSSFPSRHICVTTGHIHWDPAFSDVKLIQTIMWMAELWQYLATFQTTQCNMTEPDPVAMPVIICGDFNSLPQSGVVDFLMTGGVNQNHDDFQDYGTLYGFDDWRTLEKGAVQGERLHHKFNLDRAHKENEGVKYTNYTYDFKGMIDYVFYSKPHLRLIGSLDMIDESWFEEQKIVGCPHIHNHSDHFSLFVELELAPLPPSNNQKALTTPTAKGDGSTASNGKK